MIPKVSIIVPVYNAAAFLRDCVQSLLNQTAKELEFVFVNDGSKDNSLEILNEFALMDSRIKIVSQENKGVSAARNAGIAKATGIYIGFLDADDIVEADMYEVLSDAASKHNVDVVISDFHAEQTETVWRVGFPFEKNRRMDREEIRREVMPYFIRKDWLNSIWNKLYRRSAVVENGVLFPVGVPLGEDLIFNMKYFNIAQSALYIDYCGYHYKEIAGSATRNIKGKDYFGRLLETYAFDYRSVMDLPIDDKEIHRLKSIRFVENVLSTIHLYAQSRASHWFKYTQIRKMVKSPEVAEALILAYDELYSAARSYTRFLLKALKNKSPLAIYFAILYGKLRSL